MRLAFGSDSEFDALVYGQSNPSTVNFLQNQIEQVSTMLSDAGRTFMDRGKAAFEHFNSAAAIQFARDAVRSVVGMFDVQQIHHIDSLDAMMKANTIMQRWIMANPNARERYLNQTIDGYSDTYTNVHGQDVGHDHYDYRRATDGFMVFDDECDWKAVEYVEELKEGDRDLIWEEQCDIRRVWDKMDLLFALGKDDPTNPSGGML